MVKICLFRQKWYLFVRRFFSDSHQLCNIWIFVGVELLEARWEIPLLPPPSSFFPLMPKAYLKSPKTDHQERKKILGKVCNHRKLTHNILLYYLDSWHCSHFIRIAAKQWRRRHTSSHGRNEKKWEEVIPCRHATQPAYVLFTVL